MIKKLYSYRLEFFFITQIAILFGSLIIPGALFEDTLAPILFQLNLLAGILLISKNKEMLWFFIVLLVIEGIIFGISETNNEIPMLARYLQVGSYFAFYFVVTYEIIKQVWSAVTVNKNVIYGLISGFISLGLIGFFLFLSIELAHPDSFRGGLLVTQDTHPEVITEQLMYFSFITLMTIGYGDILPITPLAQKAAILVGLIGQFYLVIITAVVVGKFINQRDHNK